MSGRSSGGIDGSQRSGSHETPSSEERIMLPGADSKERLYEQRRDKKTFRVVTVMVYVLCVSLAAIILSLYYVFFWEPKGKHYMQVVLVAPTVTTASTLTPCLSHEHRSDTAITEEPIADNETSTALLIKKIDIAEANTTILDYENSTAAEEITINKEAKPNRTKHDPATKPRIKAVN